MAHLTFQKLELFPSTLVPPDRDSLARASNLALLGLRAIPLRTGLFMLLYD